MTRLALPLVAALTACGGGLFTITIDQSAETVVDGGTIVEALVGDLGFDEFTTMNLVESAELQNQDVQPGDIQNVRLDLFSLEVTGPAGGDLSFLEEMSLFVEAPDLPEVLIASASDFEGNAKVEFTTEEVDLTDYVVSEALTLTTDVTGSRPEETTTVEARFVLKVGVTAQGVSNNL